MVILFCKKTVRATVARPHCDLHVCSYKIKELFKKLLKRPEKERAYEHEVREALLGDYSM